MHHQSTITSRIASACLAASCCLLVPLAYAADSLTKTRETGTITIAHREASLPFSHYDADKQPIGYAVQLRWIIADAVKRERKLDRLHVEFLAVTPSTPIPAIVEGKADPEFGSTTLSLLNAPHHQRWRDLQIL